MRVIQRNPPRTADEIGVEYDGVQREYVVHNVVTKAMSGEMVCCPDRPEYQAKRIADFGKDCFEAGKAAGLAEVQRALGIRNWP